MEEDRQSQLWRKTIYLSDVRPFHALNLLCFPNQDSECCISCLLLALLFIVRSYSREPAASNLRLIDKPVTTAAHL